MSNPAVLLYNNLVHWNLPPDNRRNVPPQAKATPAKHRGLTTNFDHALRMHEIALGYIAEIRELLDTYEAVTGTDVDEFRRELPNWTAMVLSYDNGWGQAKLFDENSLRWLKTLGPMLAPLVPEFTDEDISEVDKGLKELLEILRQEKTIGRELTVYLLNLVNHMKWVLADAKLQGDFKLARVVTLLRDSVATADEVSTTPQLKPLYKRVLDKFKRKDVIVGAFEIGTAAARTIDAVQNVLPPGVLGTSGQ
ncbi:hypothetical protein [Mycolicibacter icosiumassiliensis]|uniref:hypothetical protein n=1 Tax=Mycolicibacter icosiumassiliensis TaxID=1792835 RepID=UPI0008347DE2|nr:hypothetical protein [Mycolicibacter icosiumassiliensis]